MYLNYHIQIFLAIYWQIGHGRQSELLVIRSVRPTQRNKSIHSDGLYVRNPVQMRECASPRRESHTRTLGSGEDQDNGEYKL
jgi:hypothetical protein